MHPVVSKIEKNKGRIHFERFCDRYSSSFGQRARFERRNTRQGPRAFYPVGSLDLQDNSCSD